MVSLKDRKYNQEDISLNVIIFISSWLLIIQMSFYGPEDILYVQEQGRQKQCKITLVIQVVDRCLPVTVCH